jgi:hypothetical protein
VDDVETHKTLYAVAIAEADAAAAQHELQWAAGKPGEYEILSAAADVAASNGHIQEARRLYARALENGETATLRRHLPASWPTKP